MIYLYIGVSWISKMIAFITWSKKKYSHVSWVDRKTGKEYESWMGVGVVENETWGINHTPGTVVHVYEFKHPLTEEQEKKVVDFYKKHLGEGYDWKGVLAFLPAVRPFIKHTPGKWFCSEILTEALDDADAPLYDRESYKNSPDDVGICELVHHTKTLIVPTRVKIQPEGVPCLQYN